MVSYGFDDSWEWDQGYTQDCPTSATYYPPCNGSGTITGVTKHSMTLNGLRPGNSYDFGVRSRGFTNSLPDPSKATFDNVDCSGGCAFTTLAALTTGTYDYGFQPKGPQHITAGYSVYIELGTWPISGTRTGSADISVSGLPVGITMDSPDADAGTCSASYVNATTYSYYDPGGCGNSYVKLTAASNTAVGSYTLKFTITTNGGSPTHTVSWPLTVDAATPLAQATPASYPPIPCLNSSSIQMDGSACTWNWATNMATYGSIWCVPGVGRNNGGPGDEQGAWYYDGERVYFQIHDYDQANNLTGNPAQWNTCATNWESVYGTYVTTNSGGIPGYRVFSDGPYMGYVRNGTTSDATNLNLLATKSAYAGLDASGADARLIREIQYLITANRLDAKLGANTSAAATKAVDMTLGNVDQNVVSQNADYVQPFMLGLAADALIKYYEDGNTSDVRIPVAIRHIADWLWANAWNKASVSGYVFTDAFYYNNYYFKIGTPGQPFSSASDMRNLNNLVCPLYAWLYQYTGDATYQDEGDQCWQAGVNFDPGSAIGWSGKNFSQNYRWSFDFVTWRGGH